MEYLISVIIIFISMVILAYGMLRIAKQQQENQIALGYLDTLRSYYLSIQDQITFTREFRHDLAKHIQTLEFLMAEEQPSEGLRDYADRLKEELRHLQEQKLCQNEVINAVLSIKKAECTEKNIAFEARVEDQPYRSIAEIDLVGLLFNLLDNAIEENEKIPELSRRKIFLSMRQSENAILIEIENALRTGQEVRFQTEKKDKNNHGLGLMIVHYLVKKYHGTCHTKTDSSQNLYRVSISVAGSAQ